VSFNQRIIFIEGEECSADREVYEKLYPPGTYNVSFVPAGNSATVRKTAERINDLLSSSIEFQHYYSIVDRDIERSVPAPTSTACDRLFQLPVYHVENFLLVDDLILASVREMLASQCPFDSAADVETELKQIVLSSQHLKPYASAMHDACLAKAAKAAYDAVYTKESQGAFSAPTFNQAEADAKSIMTSAVADGTWRDRCKARDVLKGFCGKHGLRYEHFRNLVISKLARPPVGLSQIMDQILSGPIARKD